MAQVYTRDGHVWVFFVLFAFYACVVLHRALLILFAKYKISSGQRGPILFLSLWIFFIFAFCTYLILTPYFKMCPFMVVGFPLQCLICFTFIGQIYLQVPTELRFSFLY